LFKFVKRPPLSDRQILQMRILAILFALIASGLVIAILGHNPLTVYYEMVRGSLGTAYRFRETINKMIPLLILSLGVCVAYKMKFWNIGGEGQFYMGAFGAGFIVFNFPDLPAAVMLPTMFIASIICGGIWALIPAILKSKFNTNETLVTLMMNYIAIRWITYLQYGAWKDTKAAGFPRMFRFPEAAKLPKVFGVHVGWIIALILVAFIYILIRYSKLGYEISVMGENRRTAEYAGMNTQRILIIAIMISGGVCGIAGMLQASGIEGALSLQLSGGLGFTAIITAWLSQLQPVTLMAVSFLFSIMLQGGSYLQSALQIPSAVSGVIQGIILFFVLGSEFFTKYTLVRQVQTHPSKEGMS
jgi:ABC-type uncharacterized transport system permease subunit